MSKKIKKVSFAKANNWIQIVWKPQCDEEKKLFDMKCINCKRLISRGLQKINEECTSCKEFIQFREVWQRKKMLQGNINDELYAHKIRIEKLIDTFE